MATLKIQVGDNIYISIKKKVLHLKCRTGDHLNLLSIAILQEVLHLNPGWAPNYFSKYIYEYLFYWKGINMKSVGLH